MSWILYVANKHTSYAPRAYHDDSLLDGPPGLKLANRGCLRVGTTVRATCRIVTEFSGSFGVALCNLRQDDPTQPSLRRSIVGVDDALLKLETS